jgi:hypothetical protein
MKGSVLEGMAGPGIRFAFLSLFILGVAIPAWAGQSGTAPPSTRAVAASVASGVAAPAAKPHAPAGQAVSAGASAAKGSQEGIKIHGHWTIEVKNPDGRLVTHREFENSLAPAGAGASLLAAILGGVATPGSWMIQVRDSATNTTNVTNMIGIAQFNTYAYSYCNGNAGPYYEENCSATPLVVTAPVYNLGSPSGNPSFTGTTLTLAGSAAVPAAFTAASIGYVETDNIPCTGSTPQACLLLPPSAPSPGGFFTFTERNLIGPDANGDPPPVPVAVGQTVNVTVVISFQ